MNAFELEIKASHAARVDEGRFMLDMLFDMKFMRPCSSAQWYKRCQLREYHGHFIFADDENDCVVPRGEKERGEHDNRRTENLLHPSPHSGFPIFDFVIFVNENNTTKPRGIDNGGDEQKTTRLNPVGVSPQRRGRLWSRQRA